MGPMPDVQVPDPWDSLWLMGPRRVDVIDLASSPYEMGKNQRSIKI